jgi:SAM-dependent methyltransferase
MREPMTAASCLDEQYRDSAKLSARIALHRKYGGRGGGFANLADAIAVEPGARVLEVGCGSGVFWRDLAERVPPDVEITLTDSSPGMVDEALALVLKLGIWSGVSGSVADVCALPFADGAFDVVIAKHMLYHADSPPTAIDEIWRVLRPGGHLVASTNGLDNMAALFELGHRVLGGERVDRMAAAFSLETGEPMLRARFGRVEVRRTRDVLRVTDPGDVVAYLTSFSPGDRASPAERARLEAETRAAFAANGGVFEIIRDTGYMLAWKDKDA